VCYSRFLNVVGCFFPSTCIPQHLHTAFYSPTALIFWHTHNVIHDWHSRSCNNGKNDSFSTSAVKPSKPKLIKLKTPS
jgi:hypothetical protein